MPLKDVCGLQRYYSCDSRPRPTILCGPSRAAVPFASASFLVVSTNDNVSGCRLSQDLAQAIIQALQKLKTASGRDHCSLV